MKRIVATLVAIVASASADAADRASGTHEGLRYGVIARTPPQMVAFYEGRGFPGTALEVVRRACFITVTLINERRDVVWVELDRWEAVGPGGAVRRIDRPQWKDRWESVSLPLAKRATFGWTLLPERRDLRPSEPVGGNLTLEPTNAPFTLTARFATGADKHGPEIVLRVPDLTCPDGKESVR